MVTAAEISKRLRPEYIQRESHIVSEKLQTYSAALNTLLQEAIRCSPESWTRGVLTIDCDGQRINYRLKNDASVDPAVISQELAQLCEQYWLVFRDNGEPWLETTIEFHQANGEWKFNSSFKHPESSPTPVPALAKSRWKFWQ